MLLRPDPAPAGRTRPSPPAPAAAMHHQEKTSSPVPSMPARSTTALAYPELYPSPIKSKVLKTEKERASPTFSLGGCSDPALLGSQAQPTASGGGAAQAQELRLSKRRPLPGKHHQCSSYGCKLAFHSMQELMDHLKVHYRPTQSLEGKTFRCPTPGCTETFPSMQDLMTHMKVHYKPNRYFKCENCMLRFRTYRSLFKHLHVCSDSSSTSSPAPNAEKPILPATSGLEKDPLAKPLEGLPKLQGVIRHMEKEAILPSMDTVSATAPASLPASLSGLHGSLESMPLVSPTSHPFPLLEPSLFGAPSLTRFSGPPHSSVPGPFLSYMPPSPYSLPQASVQHRLRPYLPSQGLPVSNAVWKKSQEVAPRHQAPAGGSPCPKEPQSYFGSHLGCCGTLGYHEMLSGMPYLPFPTWALLQGGHSSNSRIVWEHTRGRYTCMQCPYSTASREEMTLHIEDHRKNPPPPSRLDGEMDFGVGLASFHSKLTPEMENSLYSQL
ncbi:zinc finger protein 414 isoform X2 [Alligator mississippiensis]|uniref:zinc finger protein 414 isoform X2 n=1 Tax=Alligator mississippiensis TaxID=8496 RepID=UPI002877C8DB|nr:zinc finger protein 414 isoform X2 [Alligator mississippiensis]